MYSKLETVKVHQADNIEQLKARVQSLSDHLPAITPFSISFNLLEQCKKFERDNKIYFNNGYGLSETKEEYTVRRDQALSLASRHFVNDTQKLYHLPVRILCFQEVQFDEERDIESQLKNGFKIARMNGSSLSKPYGDKHLVIAHSNRVEVMQRIDIDTLGVYQKGRFQAVRFLDLDLRQSFVVVNVHQDYKSVELGNKPGANDLKRIMDHFEEEPCLITGDFNSKNLQLNDEEGKVFLGENTNLIWDEEAGKTKEELGSCDHAIMNKPFCEFINQWQKELERRGNLQQSRLRQFQPATVKTEDSQSTSTFTPD